MVSAWGAISQQAGWVVSPGAPSRPPPTLVPLKFWCAPYPSRIRPSASTALTSVDVAEEKEYERLPPLDESVATHLYPSMAIGWKAWASHPSKPCRATRGFGCGRAYSAAGQAALALHSMAVFQVFQAKMPASEEAGLDAASLGDLRSVTDLALRATKATAQAIGRLMSCEFGHDKEAFRSWVACLACIDVQEDHYRSLLTSTIYQGNYCLNDLHNHIYNYRQVSIFGHSAWPNHMDVNATQFGLWTSLKTIFSEYSLKFRHK